MTGRFSLTQSQGGKCGKTQVIVSCFAHNLDCMVGSTQPAGSFALEILSSTTIYICNGKEGDRQRVISKGGCGSRTTDPRCAGSNSLDQFCRLLLFFLFSSKQSTFVRCAQSTLSHVHNMFRSPRSWGNFGIDHHNTTNKNGKVRPRR